MPSFGLKLPHPLGQETAMARLRDFATSIHQQSHDRVQNVEQRWEGNHLLFSFSTAGLSISGRVVVEEEHALVEGQLPFAAVVFRGRIEQEIRTRLEALLR